MKNQKILETSRSFYSMTEKERGHYLEFIKSIIKDAPILNKMDSIVQKNVQHYDTDFYVCDISLLNKFKNDAFIWAIRDCGTHIFIIKKEILNVYDEKCDLSYFGQELECYYSRIKKIYFCDNSISGKLKQISIKTAFDRLKDYEELLNHQVKVGRKNEKDL